MPLQHAFDFGEPVVELAGEVCQLRYLLPTLRLPHTSRSLPAAFFHAGQLRKLMDQAPPRVAGFPYFVAVHLRAIQQTTKTREHLRGLSPQGLWPRIMGFTGGRREIV